MASASSLCDVCKISPGRYTCPRCNVFYCSTTCYQSQAHSECSETFFKGCVDEMLQSTQNNPESKRKAEELLSRINDLDELDNQLLDSDDEIEDESLEERLRNIDLDDSELVWSKLTDEEKRGYFEFLRSGDLSGVETEMWVPFWTRKLPGKVVEIKELERLKGISPGIIKIRDFKTISVKQPAECVQNNLINILASYAFMTRYFNGEHFKEKDEAVACVCNISLVLKSNHKFGNFEEAVKSVVYEYKNASWIETSEENEKLLIADLEDILEGPHVTENKYYILCCLSDLSSLFKLVLKSEGEKKDFKKQFRSSEMQFESADRIKGHVKKLGYYLSYVKDVLSNEFCTTVNFTA